MGLLEHAGPSGRGSPHEQAATDVARRVGLDITLVEWRVRDGEPAAVLRRETLSVEAADLLVVGTRGAGAHGGGTLGSTSLVLAQTATVPVVVVAGCTCQRCSVRDGELPSFTVVTTPTPIQ